MVRYYKKRAMTLVELMVAMTISIVMMGAAYYIAKSEFNSTQNQQEVMNALKEANLALKIMSSEIEAAGFMASPDMTKDPDVCHIPAFSTGAGAKRPVAIQFEHPQTSPYLGNLNQGIQPASVILMGTYPSHRVFRTNHINGKDVYLQNTGMTPVEFRHVFRPHYMLRIVNQMNKSMFFEIVARDPNNSKITLAFPVPAASGNCGVAGFGVGLAVNVVNFVRYRIKVNNNSQNPNATATLVREELDPFNSWSPMVSTPIAHNVIDLQFYDFILDLDPTGTDPNLSPFYSAASNPYKTVEQVVGQDMATPAVYLGSGNVVAGIGPKDLRYFTIKLSARTEHEDNKITYNQSGTMGPGIHKPINYFDLDANMQGLCRVVSVVTKVELSTLAARNMK